MTTLKKQATDRTGGMLYLNKDGDNYTIVLDNHHVLYVQPMMPMNIAMTHSLKRAQKLFRDFLKSNEEIEKLR